MLLKKLSKRTIDYSNGWRQVIHLTAEIRQENRRVTVKLIEESAMGKYAHERVCHNLTEAYFVAEEHTA